MTHPPLQRSACVRRAAAGALCLLAALLLAASEPPHIVSVSGDVEVGRGEPPVFRTARSGETVATGDIVRTGSDGRAELMLGRATVRLYPNSLIRVPEEGGATGRPRAVELERGRSLFDVLRSSEDPFEVRTPEIVVSVKGTRFSVAVDGEDAAVAVFRGLVGVKSLAGEEAFETLVREGFVAAGRDHFELSLHGLDDPWDGWSARELPHLPSAETVPLPAAARARVGEARAAALRDARPEAVEAAAERHPEVAERLERAKLEQARRAARDERGGEELDPVLDRRSRRLERGLGESFVEKFLNRPPDGGVGAGPAELFDLSFIDGSSVSGEDRIRVDTSGGLNWEFEEGFLDEVREGRSALPLTLSNLLAGNGVSEEEFAKGALMLFDDR